jgi:hypothetical protein
MAKTLEAMENCESGLIFVNLVDFDQQYGHRNDIAGYGAALEEFDRWLPQFRAALRPDDLAIFTADHGCDPTVPGTDHTREYVPLLVSRSAREKRRGSRAARVAFRYRADGGRQFRHVDRARRQFFGADFMRKPVMAGNWKMYKTPAETTAFFEKFRPLVEKSEHCEIVICPPFTNLAAAVDAAKGSPIRVGAQNIAWAKEGAFTGEISAACCAPWAPLTPSWATASAGSISARPMRPCSNARRPRWKPV